MAALSREEVLGLEPNLAPEFCGGAADSAARLSSGLLVYRGLTIRLLLLNNMDI